MLATALVAPLLSAAVTTAAVAASARARRRIAQDFLAWRAGLVLALFPAAVVLGWVPSLFVTAFCGIVAALALWTVRPVRRRWGHPLPRGPKWDWEHFDAAFREHIDRLERHGHGDG